MPHKLAPASIKYGLLKQCSAGYDAPYWRELRALYEGGKRLLRDRKLLEKLMPAYASESPQTWGERLDRAYYLNLFAVVVDFICAGLNLDQLKLIPPGADVAELDGVDEFWARFTANTAPVESDDRVPMHELQREKIRTGLILGAWWTLVDLPRLMPDEAPPAHEGEQRERGLLDAYAIELPPEEMIAWEYADKKRLAWAIRRQREVHRPTPFDAGDMITETFTVFTPTDQWKYIVEYSADQSKTGAVKPPKDDDDMLPIDVIEHSFGRVQVVRHVMPMGLWIGNKIESLLREYLNKSNALSYGEFKDLFQQLYEFMGTEIGEPDRPIASVQEDPNRSDKARRGPGTVRKLGADDSAMYIGPDVSGYAHTAARLETLKKEVFQVTYQIALGADQSGALAARSEGSRRLDMASTTVVLCALGDEGREDLNEVVDTVAVGRGDEAGWKSQGMENFDVADLSATIEQAVSIGTLSLPSATFQQMHAKDVIAGVLGAKATPEVMKKISAELEKGLTQDSMIPPPPLPPEAGAVGGGLPPLPPLGG